MWPQVAPGMNAAWSRAQQAAFIPLDQPEAMPELTDGRELGEAEKPEGVAVQRLPFEGTRYQCAREPLPHTRGLGQVEITAAPLGFTPSLCHSCW